MRIRLGAAVRQFQARLEPDEPGFELGIVDGRPTVRGDCDVSNADTIEAWLATFDRFAIDIDLSGVTFFGAAALRALLAATQRNPNMRIVGASPIVRRVVEVTGTQSRLFDGTTFGS